VENHQSRDGTTSRPPWPGCSVGRELESPVVPGLSSWAAWLLSWSQPGQQGSLTSSFSRFSPDLLCAPGNSPITWRWSVRAEALQLMRKSFWPARRA